MIPRIVLPTWRLRMILERVVDVAESFEDAPFPLWCVHLTSTATALYGIATDRRVTVAVRATGEDVFSAPGLDVTVFTDDARELLISLPGGDYELVELWADGPQLMLGTEDGSTGAPLASVDIIIDDDGHPSAYPTTLALATVARALADTRLTVPALLDGGLLARLLLDLDRGREGVAIRTIGDGRPALVRVGDDTVAVVATARAQGLPAPLDLSIYDLAEWADSWADLATITREDDK